LIAIRLEERDMVGFHGEAYEEYRKRTPRLLLLLKLSRQETKGRA
jgi:protein-S-isoprenylcysteine O-methyltransferase Ste14